MLNPNNMTIAAALVIHAHRWSVYAGNKRLLAGEREVHRSTEENRHQRGVTLDLESGAGVGVLERLLDGADVLIETLGPGGLDGMGLAWETLHGRYPGLVVDADEKMGNSHGANLPVKLPGVGLIRAQFNRGLQEGAEKVGDFQVKPQLAVLNENPVRFFKVGVNPRHRGIAFDVP